MPARRTSAAALSAAVDSTKQQETAPTSQADPLCRSAQAKRQPLFGRGGLGERRFSQRSGLSPRIFACLSNNFSLSIEQGELFEIDEIVALLRFTLGQNRHASGNLAARLEHQLL